jgi:high-affinity iron transporter
MLPTFVIGLREGLEAALIVGIVAAFLRQQGRSDLLRWAFVGIAAAIGLCVTAGVALELVSRDLPQRQQEGLETVIGAFAVAMVSYMVVWMKRHSRDLKGQLEGAAGAALAVGSGWALVAMAFLAVLREGLETVVFLLAAFNETGSGDGPWIGACLGILISVGLGYAVYRGGVRLNMSKFFRATGAVLVLVAAGLVVSALHTAHEAGWLNVGQQSTVDLSGVVRTGSLQSSVLTGVLGLQPRPVLIELIAWLVYLVPMLAYVVWPPGRAPRPATLARVALAGGLACAVALVPLLALRPGVPADRPVARSGSLSGQVLSLDAHQGVFAADLPTGRTTLSGVTPSSLSALAGSGSGSAAQRVSATLSGSQAQDGVPVDLYTAKRSSALTGAPATLSLVELSALNGGRLPLGVKAATGTDSVPVRYISAEQETFLVATGTHRVVDVIWQQIVAVQATTSVGTITLTAPASTAHFPADAVTAAVQAAAGERHDADHRRTLTAWAVVAGLGAAGFLLVAAAFWVTGRRTSRDEPVASPVPAVVNS